VVTRFDPAALAVVDGARTTAWIETEPSTEVICSWAADTPGDSHIEVEVQVRIGDDLSRWYSLGNWAADDAHFRRRSVPGQKDELASVEVDVLRARQRPFDAYRVRATATGAARVRALAALSSVARDETVRVSDPHGHAVDLDVPAYAQLPHRGHFPEYGGGGASWCSPASLAMVIAFWGAGPTPADLAWVGEEHEDPQVDHAARHTYDVAYGGCGNWSFGAAYAAGYGLDAVVTRIASLRDAESVLAADVPLIASISAAAGELPGFALPAGTAGHLVVVRGVTRAGDPVVNDPAAPSNAEVRRIYPRAAFERAWLGGSGGIATIVVPEGSGLPEPLCELVGWDPGRPVSHP
jgi:hypothetical protein